MEQTANLALPYIAPAQAQKHLTHNEALRILDAILHISVLTRSLTAPPANPAEGDRYLVAANPSGAWAGEAGKIAAWQDGAWAFYAPRQGWLAWITDEAKLLAFTGTAWAPAGGVASINPAPLIGVNATADAANRLSVNAPATLLNHEGAGHQLKVNKAAAGDTASLLFQRGFSGRAEMGLMGDDDLRFKVSADGADWKEAMRVQAATGAVSFPNSALGVTPKAFAQLAFPPPAAGVTFFVADAPGGPALVVSDGAGYRMTALGVAYSASVTQRDPLPTDDSGKGYAIGDAWLNSLSGHMFAAAATGIGAAVWTPLAAPALPLDVVSGAAAAYGVIRLRAAYTGPAFQLRRAADNVTQDIGFTADGVADWAAAQSFAQGGAVHLSSWYDQSGNGWHLTQPTTASQPRQHMSNKLGARPGLDFSEGRHLVIPAGLSLQRQNLTAIAAIAPNGSYYATFATFGATQAIFGLFSDGTMEIYNGVNDLGPGSWHADEAVHVAQWTPTSAARWTDDRKFTSGIATAAATMAGGAIGRTTGALAAKYGALLIYPSALPDTDVRAAQRSLTKHFGLTPQLRDRLVFVGDSISHGYSAADNMGFAHRLRALLTRPYRTVNLGVPSQTQATQAGQPGAYTKFVVSGVQNVAHVFSGTNDLAAGGTAAALQSATQSLCAALRSGGFGKIVVGTILPRGGGFSGGQTAAGFEAARQAYNAWLRANWQSVADALADYGAHPQMGVESAPANTNLYADTIHPTAQGHAYLAAVAAASLNALG